MGTMMSISLGVSFFRLPCILCKRTCSYINMTQKYIYDLLHKTDMVAAKSISSPMVTNLNTLKPCCPVFFKNNPNASNLCIVSLLVIFCQFFT